MRAHQTTRRRTSRLVLLAVCSCGALPTLLSHPAAQMRPCTLARVPHLRVRLLPLHTPRPLLMLPLLRATLPLRSALLPPLLLPSVPPATPRLLHAARTSTWTRLRSALLAYLGLLGLLRHLRSTHHRLSLPWLHRQRRTRRQRCGLRHPRSSRRTRWARRASVQP